MVPRYKRKFLEKSCQISQIASKTHPLSSVVTRILATSPRTACTLRATKERLMLLTSLEDLVTSEITTQASPLHDALSKWTFKVSELCSLGWLHNSCAQMFSYCGLIQILNLQTSNFLKSFPNVLFFYMRYQTFDIARVVPRSFGIDLANLGLSNKKAFQFFRFLVCRLAFLNLMITHGSPGISVSKAADYLRGVSKFESTYGRLGDRF